MEDPFLSEIPKRLKLADCIVDVGGGVKRFESMKEQNKYFCREMVAMARDGHDEEDGWRKLSRLEPEGIDVFDRRVEWSRVPQMRSRWKAACGVGKVGRFLFSGVSEKELLFASK